MENKDRLLQIFSRNIRAVLGQAVENPEFIQEIRMRVNAPLFMIYKNQEFYIGRNGRMKKAEDEKSCLVTQADIEETLECASHYSLYAFEEELKQGFITVSGGCRIGVAGQAVLSQGSVKTIKPVTFLNIRFSHQIKGCADLILPYLYDKSANTLFHTLIISPPMCGKTTLLRDAIRQISNGNKHRAGQNVGVVDERSEIGACFRGIPQNDVGIRTDILDGCPKAEGMLMLIRSMSPSVVAVDEIGGEKDLEAIRAVMNCGCKLLATVHGTSVEDIGRKPGFKQLFKESAFERYIVLSCRKGVGTVEAVCEGNGRSLLCG